jgi:hypothetical protein
MVCALIAAALACNLPQSGNNNQQSQNQDIDSAENSGETSDNQADTPTEPEPQPQPEIDTGKLPEFNPAAPCEIVSPAIAEEILGMPVDPIEGPGTCVYSNGSASITIGILDAETAKLSLASQILMLQDDCSMSFSYSSDQPDPTPLPPEADPLLAMSMQELMEESLTWQTTCAQTEFEALTEYGDGVYLLPFELFMPGGLVSIATDDYTLTILYTDIEMDSAGAVDVALHILELITAEE